MYKIPFYKVNITEDDIESVVSSLRSGWITRGKKAEELEEEISKIYDGKKVFCTDSCTAGLELCLRLHNIGKGDSVVTTPYTYSATADVIHNVGANIVFADTLKDKPFIDFDNFKLDDTIKAIITVDIAGVQENHKKIRELIDSAYSDGKIKQRPILISDSAHSFGLKSEYADYIVHSFHAVKNITTGEGGSIVFNRTEKPYREYKQVSLLADHCQGEKNGWEYDITGFGQNHIITDICASLGIPQVKRYNLINEKRKYLCDLYSKKLDDKINFIHRNQDFPDAYHLAMCFLPENVDRDVVYQKMLEKGVCCNVHFKPLPLMSAYKNIGFDISMFPNSYNLFERELTLPLYNELKEEEVYYICDCLNDIVRGA